MTTTTAPRTVRDRLNGGLRKIPTWVVYSAGAALAPWLFYRAIDGQLGIDPVKGMEHQLGLWALQFLIASLCITPLMKHARINAMKFRRALGLLAFYYIVLHLGVWLAFDLQFRWGEIWADIVKRWYITIGMAAFVLALPLALTSWNGAVRRMGGAAWRKLHKLAYPVALLGAVHFAMQEKVWTIESLIYLFIVFGLLALRGRKLIQG